MTVHHFKICIGPLTLHLTSGCVMTVYLILRCVVSTLLTFFRGLLFPTDDIYYCKVCVDIRKRLTILVPFTYFWHLKYRHITRATILKYVCWSASWVKGLICNILWCTWKMYTLGNISNGNKTNIDTTCICLLCLE